MAEHPTSNAQLILALLNTIVRARPGFDEALDAIRAAIESPTVWRCFHCDEVFTDRASALEHFGASQLSDPACKIDAAEYRRMEECCHSHHAEDTELHRALHAKDAEMRSKVREAEEQGYERGLKDAKKHPETLGLQRAAIASNGELSPAVHVVDGLEILAEPEPHEPIEVLPDGSVRAWPLCSDCPPVDYPTDKTRCAECDRKSP